jgi:pyruvate/2-oxoglutarate/acetoin dehydrogenase E1 component
MPTMTYLQAISDGMRTEMRTDDRVFCMGEDIGVFGGAFKVTDGFIEEFGPDRVMDTPLAESGIVGTAVGAAVVGMRPVCEMQFSDFISCGFDQLVNVAGKMHYRLMLAAIRDPNPVLFCEHKFLYRRIKGEVPEGAEATPMRARIARDGDDLVVITYGAMVHTALEATEEMEGVRVLDLRSLVPLDEEAILESVRACSKVVIVDEANELCAAGAQVAAIIAERGFEDLDGPVVRVATPNVPIPFSPPLEQALLPSVDRVKEACRELLEY